MNVQLSEENTKKLHNNFDKEEVEAIVNHWVSKELQYIFDTELFLESEFKKIDGRNTTKEHSQKGTF